MKLDDHESIAAEEVLGAPQDLQFTSFDIHQQSVEWTARVMEIRKRTPSDPYESGVARGKYATVSHQSMNYKGYLAFG